jgi:hypothetical protein
VRRVGYRTRKPPSCLKNLPACHSKRCFNNELHLYGLPGRRELLRQRTRTYQHRHWHSCHKRSRKCSCNYSGCNNLGRWFLRRMVFHLIVNEERQRSPRVGETQHRLSKYSYRPSKFCHKPIRLSCLSNCCSSCHMKFLADRVCCPASIADKA